MNISQDTGPNSLGRPFCCIRFTSVRSEGGLSVSPTLPGSEPDAAHGIAGIPARAKVKNVAPVPGP
jgi:hypothetical protein